MLAGHLALIVAAVFTGAAFYINFAEQPARLDLEPRAFLIQWRRAYARGYTMQAGLVAVGTLLGLVGMVADARHQLAGRRGGLRRQRALHAARHHAGQQCAEGDRPGECPTRKRNAPKALGDTPRCADGTGIRGDVDFSDGIAGLKRPDAQGELQDPQRLAT